MKNTKVVTTLLFMATAQVGLSANILIHKMLQNNKFGKLNSELGGIKNVIDKEINYIEAFQKTECNNETNQNCAVHDAEKRKCVCVDGIIIFRYENCQECDCSFPGGTWKNRNDFFNHNGKCIDCECGNSSQSIDCEFRDGEKRCNCPDLHLQKEDRCVECDCGPGGTCSFNEDGDKLCTCQKYYAEKDGKCEECDCGPKGTCSFNEENYKLCHCQRGYADKNGKCEKSECDCGPGGTCGFNEYGDKLCICQENYADKDGKCVECDCKNEFEAVGCEFIDGKKECNCPLFEAQKDDQCVNCYCGDDVNCSFVGDKKKCFCLEGFVERAGYCEECNCGRNGKCSLFYGLKECECDVGFGNKHGFCSACDCGQNVSCTFTLRWNSYEKSCICPEGYQEIDERCEEIGRLSSTVGELFPETTDGVKRSTATSSSAPVECDPAKCLHGTCEMIGRRYICQCDEGFIGKHCDVRREEIPGYSYLWIVYVALFNVTVLLLITTACLYCKSKRNEKKV